MLSQWEACDSTWHILLLRHKKSKTNIPSSQISVEHPRCTHYPFPQQHIELIRRDLFSFYSESGMAQAVTPHMESFTCPVLHLTTEHVLRLLS